MKYVIPFIFLIIALNGFSQEVNELRCPYKGNQIPAASPADQVGDFTITDTEGNELNLYTYLDAGYTIFVDLYYTRCGWCQTYAPIIEQVYQNHGAGQGTILFWGISSDPYDTDPVIDQYKTNYDVTNPCAGPQGNGVAAHNTVIAGQQFLGWPTYCVICPDRSMFFDPVYPPTVSGFDPYFEQCAAVIGIDDPADEESGTRINTVFPNPADKRVNLEIITDHNSVIRIELYSSLGIKVRNDNRFMNSGNHNISFDVSDLPQGQYFIRLVSDASVGAMQKVVVR